jgi:hypothetical protein
MCNLRVGQKVVCVDVPWPEHTAEAVRLGVRLPEAGRIYTIRWLGTASDGFTYCRLVEIENPIMKFPGWPAGEARFGVRRFRPLVTRKTDISQFKAMLTPSKQGVPA